MAARTRPSWDRKPHKLMRHVAILELHREAENADGHVTKGPRLIARKLVDKAIDGDVRAIEEIRCRLGGEALKDPTRSGRMATG